MHYDFLKKVSVTVYLVVNAVNFNWYFLNLYGGEMRNDFKYLTKSQSESSTFRRLRIGHEYFAE